MGKSLWTPGLKNKTYIIGMVLTKGLQSLGSEVFLVTLTDTTSVYPVGRHFWREVTLITERTVPLKLDNSFNIFLEKGTFRIFVCSVPFSGP